MAPLEEVRVSAVGDQHESQQVGQGGDLLDVLLGGLRGEVELEHPDHLTALGDRRENPPRVADLAAGAVQGDQRWPRLAAAGDNQLIFDHQR